ncbi:unnamed protein product [Acanthoscelides obtectus]|uniref:DDE Tnp4 domain-containing protein n=1 Tax=Acanthoscelides obtectus TaxID=200917 RepID=A0A9P0P8Q1_ACAOB|nr:unnamed protein product [Acanthoscelides obtectus]CAK1655992.1 Putative nuclease HARBI1 [Acanthoscelides obtectus]
MNSRICRRFEDGEFSTGILLGDSGYDLQPFLLTPLEEPRTRPEQLYNESLIKTRNIIERTISVWKKCFPCLAYGMRLKTETAMTVVVATAVLHNFARQMSEPEPPVENRNRLNCVIDLGQMTNSKSLPNHVGHGQLIFKNRLDYPTMESNVRKRSTPPAPYQRIVPQPGNLQLRESFWESTMVQSDHQLDK